MLNVRISEVILWLDQTFRNVPPPYPEDATLKVKIRFTVEVLRLAHDITSLQYASGEMLEILGGMMLLMKEYKDLSLDYHSLHWCGALKLQISKREKTLGASAKIGDVDELVQECLENLKTACVIRTNKQIAGFLQIFRTYMSIEKVTPEISESFVLQIFQELDFARRRVEYDPSLSHITMSKTQPEGDFRQMSLKQIAPEERTRQMDETSMDIFLLKLLFRSNKKDHERTALEIIISNFDQRILMRQMLEGAELLVEDIFREKYKKLKVLYNRLRILLQDLHQLSDIKLFKEDGISYQLAQYSDVFNLICAEVRKVVDLNEPAEIRRISQRIARNVGIFALLFEFLGTKFYWVERGNPMPLSFKQKPGKQKKNEDLLVIKEDEGVSDLYRNAVSALYSMCYANLEIQVLAFDKISLLLRLMDNKIGLSKLLGQAIASQRATENASFIIEYVFMDLLAHTSDFNSRPHDIKMLNYLIFGEESVYFTENQTQIFQAIIKYEPFREKYHRAGNLKELYFADFRSEDVAEIKFFSILLALVVKCSIQNRYVTVEARRLFPHAELLTQLKDQNLHIKLRKIFYHYFFFVCCMETHDGLKREVELNQLVDFLATAMIPDLQRFHEFLPQLYTLARKGCYWPVPCKAAEKQWLRTNSAQLQGGSLKAMLFGGVEVAETDLESDAVLTEKELSARKYWKAIILFKPWKPKLSSGMISLFMDLLMEIKAHNVSCSTELMEQLEIMRGVITSLIEQLRVLQRQHPDMVLDYLIAKLETIFDLYPQEDLNMSFDNEVARQHEALRMLAGSVQNYILKADISLDNFLSSLCQQEVVTKQELISALKSLFGKETTYHQLEIVMDSISRTEVELYLDDFGRAIKPYLHSEIIANPPTLKQIPDRFVLSPINKELRQFLKTTYRTLSQEAEMQELQELVDRIQATIIEPALVKGDLEEIRRLNTNLEKAFRDSKHKVYLLRIYQFIIQRVITNPMKPRNERLLDLRKIVQESAITEMAAGLVYLGNTPSIIMEAFNLLNTLLTNNLKETQERLLETIKDKIDHFQFLSFIRFNIRGCLTRIEALAVDQKRSQAIYQRSNYKPVDAQARISEEGSVSQATSPRLSRLVLEFLTLCSDSCHTGFQHYFRTQGEEGTTVSIDLVNEISVFLINLQKNEDLKCPEEVETNMVAHYALVVLINLCSGPCRENQVVIGTRRQIYEFVNLVIEEDINFKLEENYFLDIFENSITLLTALLEGSAAPEVSKLMLKVVKLDRLTHHATNIYQQLIVGREALIYQENAGEDQPLLRCFKMRGEPVTASQTRIIEAGYQINILIRTLNDLHPNMNVLSSIIYKEAKHVLLDEQNAREVLEVMEEDDAETQLNRKLMYESRNLLRWGRLQFGLSESGLSPKMAAFRFYSANIASVEINHKGQLVRQMFHIPSMCRFLSTRSREAVITKVKRTSHQEKIDDFFNRTSQYEKEMEHRQKLAKYPGLHLVCKLWEMFATVSFWLVLAVNLTILFAVYHDGEKTGSWTWDNDYIHSKEAVQALGFIQMVLSALILVGHLVEYYPVIIYKRSEKHKVDNPAQFFHPKWISIKGTTLIRDIIERTKRKITKLVEHPPISYKIVAIAKDPSVIYHTVYCVISIVAWIKFLWYPILLLDVVKRREDLVNVLKSITLNYKSLILTLVLGIITIYLFTIVAINLFPEFYLNESTEITNTTYNAAATYCTNLLDCFFSTLIQGVRPGGGIGDNLWIPDFYDEKYWPLFVFDMLYFILVVIVLLNIIFGIIIDTFAELRDERKDMLYDIEHKCFVCGLDKFQFEVARLPWMNHINMEHNVYAYLAFIIYIKQLKEEDCNGIELYVKSQIREKEVAFFPTNSLSLQAVLTEDEEKTQQEAKEIQALIAQLKVRSHSANS